MGELERDALAPDMFVGEEGDCPFRDIVLSYVSIVSKRLERDRSISQVRGMLHGECKQFVAIDA